jgi:hypothetical protein
MCGSPMVVNSGGVGEYVAASFGQYPQFFGGTGLGALLPAHSTLYPEFIQAKGLGCGCAGIGCGCAGVGDFTMDGTGLFGTGLFAGDISTWGIGEWVVIILGGYMIFSTLFTTSRGVKRVKTGYSNVKKRRAKIAKAQKSKGFFG